MNTSVTSCVTSCLSIEQCQQWQAIWTFGAEALPFLQAVPEDTATTCYTLAKAWSETFSTAPEALGNPEGLATLKDTLTHPALQASHIEGLRLFFTGKKGILGALKKQLKEVPPELKAVVGQNTALLTQTLELALAHATERLAHEALVAQLETERVDVTLPGLAFRTGKPHPISQAIEEMTDIFRTMGFQILDPQACPEIETDFYNFDALNFRQDHPARDMQDTFYTQVAPHVLLRSQTSNAQIRHMEAHTPPLAVVAPGRVYRNEDITARKYVLFHQIEGLWVSHVQHPIRFSDLKGVLDAFIKQYLGESLKTRFRASYFPFTEPSAEMDVACIFCHGDGCKVCSHTGWLEVLGCGMVHPNVLKAAGYNPEEVQGFAFGLGVERFTMLRHQVHDIRLFYQNDPRFLQQFPL
ncbi:MAG: phenylalanine--tRNA ligase subunit alpha [Vampirovibrionales bacterium]